MRYFGKTMSVSSGYCGNDTCMIVFALLMEPAGVSWERDAKVNANFHLALQCGGQFGEIVQAVLPR